MNTTMIMTAARPRMASTWVRALLSLSNQPHHLRVVGIASSQQQYRAHSTRLRNTNNKPQASRFSVADFVATMRWKAVQALTASLPAPERHELLQQWTIPSSPSVASSSSSSSDSNKTNATPPPDNTTPDAAAALLLVQQQTTHSQSIAEAVAAARAEDSQRYAEQWERDKAVFLADAQKAARARVESEWAVRRFAQWQEQVANATQTAEEEETAVAETTAAPETPECARIVAKEEIVPSLEEDASIHPVVAKIDSLEDSHPILGPCLLDLGYKRLHVVEATALSAIPVWEEQRVYRHDRAKAMAADKQRTMHFGIPGVIGLYEDADGTLSILDGQHRVGMFSILAKNKKDPAGILNQILVEVYPHKQLGPTAAAKGEPKDSHAQDIFLEINKAEPVKLVDMPGVAKVSHRKILADAADALYQDYRPMFSASARCRSPHVNRDNLRDALFAANVIPRHKIQTAAQLVEWMILQNNRLADHYEKEHPRNDATNHTPALEKAREHHFFLGLDTTWYFK